MTEPAARPTPGPTPSAEEARAAEFDRERYARHLPIPGIGERGQALLAGARVLMVGAGGLGSPVGLYLAAAGVGHLTIVDDDRVDLTNLQRQVLHRVADIGRPKVDSARERLAALNPGISIDVIDERLSAGTVDGIIAGHDLVIDGTDNFATRYLIADACARAGVVEVWGSVRQLGGQVSVFGLDLGGGRRVWLRDLYPEPPAPETVQTAEQTGILGTVPGTIGTIMATEAVKVITGFGEPLSGRVLFYDSAAMSFREFRFAGDAGAVRDAADVGDAAGVRDAGAGR